MQKLIPVLIFAAGSFLACERADPSGDQRPGDAGAVAGDLTSVEISAIARDAYVYGFPMVMNVKTINEYVIDTDSPDYKGPFNQVSCEARLFTPADRTVVTPNSDTPYCMFWMDLRAQPQVMSVPDIDAGRYYGIQLIDLYTHNFAYIGTRTNDNRAGNYLLAGPGWDGERPEGVRDVLRSETDLIFAVIRTQVFDDADLERVEAIQASYRISSLADFLGETVGSNATALSFPPWEAGVEFTPAALGYLDFVLDLVDTHPDEADLMARFARIGIGTPDAFDFASLDPAVAEAVEAGVQQGIADIRAAIDRYSGDPLMSAKILGTRDALRESAAALEMPDFYLLRASAAMVGLYGNSGEEAIYPAYFTDSGGEPLDAAAHDYVMRFAGGGLPPVRAFWSLSMYDGQTQLFIDNPLDRYLLNSSMTDQFVREDDGTIVFNIQKESPGDGREANWLPAPDGPFYMILRLYLPEEAALGGDWTPPIVARVDSN
ncbi:MAG: DUF1254 domain-containing protein [Gemmatimonadota bacterium]